MNNQEEDRSGYWQSGTTSLAMGLTCQEAIAEARRQLCALGWGCSASDAEIVAKIRNDCTLFVGSDPIRLAIFGTAQCPTTAKSCLEGNGGGGGGGNNTMLLVGLAAVAGLAAVILATAPTSKKIIVAKVAP